MRSILKLPALIGFVAALGFGFLEAGDGVWLLMLAVSGLLLAILLWPARVPGQPLFNRTVQRLATLLLIGFVLTSFQLVRQQVLLAEAITARAEVAGDRVMADPRRRQEVLRARRGAIYDRGGQLLAGTEALPGNYTRRTYPADDVDYLIGYHSPLIYGENNLEERYNEILSGAASGGWSDLQRRLLHRPVQGYDLHLTLDIGLQRVAAEALGDRPGSVVVINPKTGAVLAMVANPNFEPERLVFDPSADDWNAESTRIIAAWRDITSDPSNPLLLRSTQGLYTPGSIFKTIVTAAALESGIATPESRYEDRGELNVDSHIIRELNRPDPPKNQYTLAEAYRYSLNVVYAQIALQLGANRLQEAMRRFGFDETIPFDLPVVPSQSANSPDFLKRRTGLADTGYGQGELQVTPLHMALVAAAVANNGTMMQPHLVGRVVSPDGRVVQQWKPVAWRTVMSPETARTLRELMVSVVDQNLPPEVRIPGVIYGGKTGTAEIGDGNATHAWFMAYGPEPDPQLAISVLVERGGGGGRVAAPIAKTVMEYAVQGRR